MSFINKKILVTGADGFIGSHLVETLLDEGWGGAGSLNKIFYMLQNNGGG